MNDPLTLLILASLLMAIGIWLFWPRGGALGRWQRTRHFTQRIQIEDALKHMYDCEYHGRACSLQSLAGVLHSTSDAVAALFNEMERRDFTVLVDGAPQLTARGRDYALHIIRAHRLWESYLAERTGYTPEDWHRRSEQREHELTIAETNALAATLGYPRFDPHGDPIPNAEGKLSGNANVQSLADAPLNQPMRIVHLEDEPPTVYAQLLAEGIHLGMQVVVIERAPHRIHFWSDGDDHVLAPLLANSISVVPIPQLEAATTPAQALSTLPLGESATVLRLSPHCQGAERRRLLDLGILPGTTIRAEMISPSGDPTAYRIRGSLIGLRQEQAALIQIQQPTAVEKQTARDQQVEVAL